MALEKYRGKRDFSKTLEPSGSREDIFEGIFVVQKHAATHLHWDFRLSLDGVLKSWAVPKEPPIGKGMRRLAIQVEDHPLDYVDFEGEIPEGLYGAGKVEIWDKGKFGLIKREKGKIEVALHGSILKGEYVLLKFPKAGENSWLFFKK